MTKHACTHRIAGRRALALLAGLPLLATGGLLASPASASSGAQTPINDDFANSFPIVDASGRYGDTNLDATVEQGEPDPLPGHPAAASSWTTWTPQKSGTVTFTTRGSDFDTVLSAYTGSSLGTLTQVAVDDDATFDGLPTLQSRISFAVIAGTPYHIAIDAASPQELGTLIFSWLSNDNFSDAVALNPTIGTVSEANVGATHEPGEPSHAGKLSGASTWYTWQAPFSGLATIEVVSPQFDSLLAVYKGTTLAGLTPVVSNDDISPTNHASKVSFTATAGQTYRIAVDSKTGEQGNFLLQNSLVGPTVTTTGSKIFEGNSGTHAMNFTVKLSRPSDTAITVNYTTAAGTATSGSDYIAKTGKVIFTPGQTVKTVSVLVKGDKKKEGNETLRLAVTSALGGPVTYGAYLNGTIKNDD